MVADGARHNTMSEMPTPIGLKALPFNRLLVGGSQTWVWGQATVGFIDQQRADLLAKVTRWFINCGY